MPRQDNYSNWTQTEKDAFRRANRIKAKYQFSNRTLWNPPFLILVFGIVVFAFSSEKVNQNTVFFYFTLLQGVAIIPFYVLLKRTGKVEYLLNGLIVYIVIWFLEIVLFGFPNELLAAYNTVQIGGGNIVKSSVKFLHRPENENREVYAIFPFVYSGVKLFFAVVMFVVFRNFYRWVKLSDEMKERVG